MQFNTSESKMVACRRLAMEQNQKLFNQANALNRSAFDLLDRPDLDSEKFDDYLLMRRKAETLFREAIEHLCLLNEDFAPSASLAKTNLPSRVKGAREIA